VVGAYLKKEYVSEGAEHGGERSGVWLPRSQLTCTRRQRVPFFKLVLCFVPVKYVILNETVNYRKARADLTPPCPLMPRGAG